MAVTHGYCTVAELREHLGDAGTKLAPALLERAINAASRAIDRHTHRRFWLDVSATARRCRPDLPDVAWVHDIGSTTDLVVESDEDGDGAFEVAWTVDVDYQLEPLDADVEGEPHAWTTLRAVGDRRFPVASRRGRPTLRVTALHGWSAVPDEVTEAAILRAAALFSRRESINGVAGFGEFGAVRITRRDPDVIELLEPYVRVHVGGI